MTLNRESLTIVTFLAILVLVGVQMTGSASAQEVEQQQAVRNLEEMLDQYETNNGELQGDPRISALEEQVSSLQTELATAKTNLTTAQAELDDCRRSTD